MNLSPFHSVFITYSGSNFLVVPRRNSERNSEKIRRSFETRFVTENRVLIFLLIIMKGLRI